MLKIKKLAKGQDRQDKGDKTRQERVAAKQPERKESGIRHKKEDLAESLSERAKK